MNWSAVQFIQEEEAMLSFTDPDRIQYRLPLSDILAVRSAGHKLHIFTAYTTDLCTNYTLAKLADISGDVLIQCHKSFLVNRNYIHNIDFTNKVINLSVVPKEALHYIPIGRKYLSFLNHIF